MKLITGNLISLSTTTILMLAMLIGLEADNQVPWFGDNDLGEATLDKLLACL